MQRRRLIIVAGLFIGLIGLAAWVVFSSSQAGTERIRPPASIETINSVEFRHYFIKATGINWHYVEAGHGDTILFLHGIPGAWYSWHRVMEPLSKNYRVIAIDLKGLGLTDNPEGSYSASVVADEIATLMDAIGVQKFSLVSHEWGSIVGSYLAAQSNTRVTHFVRIETPLSDAALAQIATLKANPALGKIVLADGAGFVTRMYTGKANGLLMANVPGPVVVQPISAEDIARIIKEFSYKGIPDSVARYYTDTPSDYRTTLAQLAAKTTLPVLLLQGDSDPIQPAAFYKDSAAPFPNATLQILEKTGHVPMLEQPDTVANLINMFVSK